MNPRYGKCSLFRPITTSPPPPSNFIHIIPQTTRQAQRRIPKYLQRKPYPKSPTNSPTITRNTHRRAKYPTTLLSEIGTVSNFLPYNLFLQLGQNLIPPSRIAEVIQTAPNILPQQGIWINGLEQRSSSSFGRAMLIAPA